MNQQDHFSSLFAPSGGKQVPITDLDTWKILLVDDEPDIHAVLSLALQDTVAEHRSLQLLNAASGAEALVILAEHPDIAVILLDVVMETEQSGLELVRYIRNKLDNHLVQIILVTGQPGYAPQREVISDYEIDGYRLKSELTADKIFASIITALRTHQALRSLDRQRRKLETQAKALKEQHEALRANETVMRQQNDELLATEEQLRVQLEESEVSQRNRKVAEEALRESETWHRSIVESALDGFWLVDTEGRLLEVNRAYCRMSGYSESELLTMCINDLEVLETQQDTAERIQTILKTGEDRFESKHRCKSGRTIDVEVSIQYRAVNGGRFVTFLRDITERRQLDNVQRFLAEACSGTTAEDPFFNTLARYLAENLGMDFVCIDRLERDNLSATTLAVWSDGHFEDNVTYSLHDTPCGDVVGKDICCFPESVCQLFPRDLVLQELQAESYIGVTLWSRSNQPIGLIAVIGKKPLQSRALAESILKHVAMRAASELERLEAEDERAKLESRLQQAQRMESLGVLAGGIAHDFNNLLAVIIGHCALAKLKPTTTAENIDSIETAAERAAALCQQMLAYAGKARVTKSRIRIELLIDEMVRMARSTINQNVQIISDLAADIPPITADASQVRQIAMNLIMNAAEAIGYVQGVVTVSLNRRVVSPERPETDHLGTGITPGWYACLEVSDTGCGMDAETQQRIFEPFFTTKFTGRGLGMSAVLGIIKAHNGALQLYSQPGQGSQFKVYLPVPVDAPEEHTTPQSPEASEPWRGKGLILLVEDEEMVMTVGAAMLEELGFDVIKADNGEVALRLYKQNPSAITIVVTDIGMPIMDGYELIDKLKALTPDLPILVSSGFGEMTVNARLSGHKIAGSIGKPFNFIQLRDILKRVTADLDS